MALVVLLWASLRVRVSVNVTAWVADDAAVGQGHSQPLPELQSSFGNEGSWRGWGGHQNPALLGRGILRPYPDPRHLRMFCQYSRVWAVCVVTKHGLG